MGIRFRVVAITMMHQRFAKPSMVVGVLDYIMCGKICVEDASANIDENTSTMVQREYLCAMSGKTSRSLGNGH